MELTALRTSMLLSTITILALLPACGQEISHTESDKPNWFGGGRTHQETTVIRNPDGSISTSHEKQSTNP